MAESTVPTVLIAGAGIAGLTLAQALKRAGISFRVFERDPSVTTRSQGYRIRISEDGAATFKEYLSEELYAKFEKTCAETRLGMSRIDGISGELVKNPLIGQNPRMRQFGRPFTVDRMTLRTLLLTGVEDCIEYGKEVKGYTATSTSVTLEFKDGSSTKGEFLIAADGGRSVIRKQYLPNQKPVDTEGRCIYGKTPLTPELQKQVPDYALQWITAIVEESCGTPLTLFLEPVRFQNNEFRSELPEDYVYWVLLSRKSVFGLSDDEFLRMTHEEAHAFSLKITAGWHPSLRPLLELQDVQQSIPLRLSSVTPVIDAWEPSRVTLVGDAAHAMPPTGGRGANTALRDVAVLAKRLEEGLTVEKIAEYEQEMRVYAGEAIEISAAGGKSLFGMRPFEELRQVEY
ncbi:MAG: hypothetical protein M1834_008488 [Cirrosporium novae-zelandiae]|nr:MAG: hypothetical protein M1834_008488 [Cirrosporium novae-zelandiae]